VVALVAREVLARGKVVAALEARWAVEADDLSVERSCPADVGGVLVAEPSLPHAGERLVVERAEDLLTMDR
jgi:hypothetical protein